MPFEIFPALRPFSGVALKEFQEVVDQRARLLNPTPDAARSLLNPTPSPLSARTLRAKARNHRETHGGGEDARDHLSLARAREGTRAHA